MPHFQDQETLQRLLGVEVVPVNVLEEADIRTRMYHAAGASGPLGIVAMISLVRDMGLNHSGPAGAASGKTDWRALPQDGTVRIEAGPFFGSMLPGVFLGFVQAGMLAIHLDDDHEGYVREVRADMVRLSAVQNPPQEGAEDAAKPDARFKPPLASKKADVVEHDEPPIEFSDPEDEVAGDFDWTVLSEGDPVMVEFEDGKGVEGKFKRQAKNGKIEVSIPGSKKTKYFAPDVVRPVA